MIRASLAAFVSAVSILLVACHLNETPIKYDCDCDVACLDTNGEVSSMGWWSGTVKDPGGMTDAEDKASRNCQSVHEGDCGGQPMCDCDCWVAEPGG
jgi:hypothetical protein